MVLRLWHFKAITAATSYSASNGGHPKSGIGASTIVAYAYASACLVQLTTPMKFRLTLRSFARSDDSDQVFDK
jgi:hypothetical protein